MIDIETRLFRYFVMVADEKHFARAAVRLEITPPTLTHQIKKLERLLGVKLLVRRTSSLLELTDAGTRFLEQARNVLLQAEEAERVARQAARGEIGRIDVGYMPSTTSAGVIQKFIGEFQRINPSIEITLHRMAPMDQISAIIRNDIDFGFSREPYQYPAGLQGFDVFRQPVVLALPSEHPLARHERINPAALKNEAFINTSLELDVGFSGDTQAVTALAGFTPKVVKRVTDMFTALTYVSIGYGVAVVSKSLANFVIPNVTYRELAMKSVPVTSLAFIYRRDASSPAARIFRDYMRQHALAPVALKASRLS